MDDNTNNVTKQLVQIILELTKAERHSARVQSICQYIQCTFPNNEHDNLGIPCDVSSEPFTTSDDVRKEDLYLTIITKFIHVYIYPLFILMGILGNSLSCFIMFNNVRRSGYPSSLYLTLLAFIDGLFLLGSALPDWISKIHYRVDIKLLSDISCRFVYWFGNLATHLSAGLVVGVTVERFIAVQYPFIAHKINTVTHTRIVLIILISFLFLVDSPVFILVKHVNGSTHNVYACNNDTHANYERRDSVRCALANQWYERAWVYFDLAVYTLIPFFIIITLNSLIIRRLIDAQRFRQRMFRFNNNTSRYDQEEIKHRHYSENHEAMEMSETYIRHSRRFQTVLETKPLAIMLRPKLSQFDEQRIRFNTKQSSISTELSTLSFELKTRSHHRLEMSSLRHKSVHISNSNNTRLTILLLFVSCSFLALTLPIVAFNLILSIKLKNPSSTFYNNHLSSTTNESRRSDTVFYYTIARLLMIINHSINFILYFVLGKRFRRDLKQLFIGYWRKLYRRRRHNK